MKQLIILTLLISLSAFAQEKSEYEVYTEPVERVVAESNLKKEFLKETGLVEGEYILAKGSDEECSDGPLEVKEDGGEITILYGARAFVTGLGKGKLQESYNGCDMSITSSYKGSVIEETSEEVCKKNGKAVVKTVVKVEKNKIFYTRSLFTDDKPTKTMNCTANLKKKN